MKTFEQGGVMYGVVVVPDNAMFISIKYVHGHSSVKYTVTSLSYGINNIKYIDLPNSYTYSILGTVRELTEAQCAEMVDIGECYKHDDRKHDTAKTSLDCRIYMLDANHIPDDNLLILKVENK